MMDNLIGFPGLDLGEAAISISLLDGKVIVTNKYTGVVLAEGVVQDGFWNSLWDHIEDNMRVTYRIGKS